MPDRTPGAEPSPQLRAFLAGGWNRLLIHDFVATRARELPASTRVLDAGSGPAPYRELFSHCEYRTADWQNSIYDESAQSDYVGSLDDLPIGDGSFDVILLTEVLEHVADPQAVLSELRRILAPEGRLLMTTPFVWQLHEEPYDYFRYTEHGLRALLERSSLDRIEVTPLGGYFATVGQLMRNCAPIIGVTRSHGPVGARATAGLMRALGPVVRRLDRFDRGRSLPIGYAVDARRAPS